MADSVLPAPQGRLHRRP